MTSPKCNTAVCMQHGPRRMMNDLQSYVSAIHAVVQTRKVQERLSEARAQLEPWTAKLQDCQNARNLNAAKLQCLIDQATAGDARLQRLREQLHSATIEVKSAGDEIAALEAEVSEQKALHQRATAAGATARTDVKAAEQAVGDAHASASGLRVMLDAERSRGAVLTALKDAQARGQLSVWKRHVLV
jgi:chromosome segregation ATPase